MPEIRPTRNETYLCTGVEIGPDRTYWLTGFKPVGRPGSLHHIIVAACSEKPPATTHNVWNCGAGGNPVLQPGYDSFVTCSDGDLFTNTLYLWSRGGQPYQLPGDVGLPIGGDTKHQYLVLQLHYLNVDLLPTSGDTSGVDLQYTELEPEKSAGVVSVHVTTLLPPLSQTYQDGGCRIGEKKILHPLSYIVHTHARGQVVSAWRVRQHQRAPGLDHWSLIGRKSPLAPQSFYPVSDPAMRLVEGDRLAVRCTMLNLSSRTVRQGLASYDEMCDVYLMYWVWGNHTRLLQGKTYCTNPSHTSWANQGFNNIPEVQATTL